MVISSSYCLTDQTKLEIRKLHVQESTLSSIRIQGLCKNLQLLDINNNTITGYIVNEIDCLEGLVVLGVRTWYLVNMEEMLNHLSHLIFVISHAPNPTCRRGRNMSIAVQRLGAGLCKICQPLELSLGLAQECDILHSESFCLTLLAGDKCTWYQWLQRCHRIIICHGCAEICLPSELGTSLSCTLDKYSRFLWIRRSITEPDRIRCTSVMHTWSACQESMITRAPYHLIILALFSPFVTPLFSLVEELGTTDSDAT
ncbi:hypothetical protein VNO77_18851 [Canavalia gladiata]|uniref:Uncharacterized protein n=1 Tax=Canavalia gladiata TaxID=3824 RepID=A0AAN9LLK0_CANGL